MDSSCWHPSSLTTAMSQQTRSVFAWKPAVKNLMWMIHKPEALYLSRCMARGLYADVSNSVIKCHLRVNNRIFLFDGTIESQAYAIERQFMFWVVCLTTVTGQVRQRTLGISWGMKSDRTNRVLKWEHFWEPWSPHESDMGHAPVTQAHRHSGYIHNVVNSIYLLKIKPNSVMLRRQGAIPYGNDSGHSPLMKHDSNLVSSNNGSLADSFA